MHPSLTLLTGSVFFKVRVFGVAYEPFQNLSQSTQGSKFLYFDVTIFLILMTPAINALYTTKIEIWFKQILSRQNQSVQRVSILWVCFKIWYPHISWQIIISHHIFMFQWFPCSYGKWTLVRWFTYVYLLKCCVLMCSDNFRYVSVPEGILSRATPHQSWDKPILAQIHCFSRIGDILAGWWFEPSEKY